MAHGDAREGKWRGKMRMEWVASSLALYVGIRSIQSLSADPHSSTASSRLNWHPRRFKWTRPFRWKTKSGFCACAITFQTCYTSGGGEPIYSEENLPERRFVDQKYRILALNTGLYRCCRTRNGPVTILGIRLSWDKEFVVFPGFSVCRKTLV